jgi:hypothetical protein
MRVKIASIAITLPIILLIGLLFMAYTQNVSDTHIQSVQKLERQVKNQQWDQALIAFTELSASWEAKKPWLQLWVDHADVDEVSKYIMETHVGLTLQEESVFFISTANLIESLMHLHHKDDLSLANII